MKKDEKPIIMYKRKKVKFKHLSAELKIPIVFCWIYIIFFCIWIIAYIISKID